MGAGGTGVAVTRPKISFLASFRFASQGLRYLFLTQRNARVQAGAGAVALLLAAVLRCSRDEWAILALTIGAVLALEGVNSAVEAVVDLVTEEYHPLAKVAKDVAAGAVWLMALTAVVVGAILFLPRLAGLVGR